jgi:hypothetical protein
MGSSISKCISISRQIITPAACIVNGFKQNSHSHQISAAIHALQTIHRVSDPTDADSAVAKERDGQYKHLIELKEKRTRMGWDLTQMIAIDRHVGGPLPDNHD